MIGKVHPPLRFFILLFLMGISICIEPIMYAQNGNAIIIDHTCTDITAIPQTAIENAKKILHIVYSHTSHGSQLTYGMTALANFMNELSYPHNLYAWNENYRSDTTLYLRDFNGLEDVDIFPRTSAHVRNGATDWAEDTRNFLNDTVNSGDVNVMVWSWCGGVSGATEEQIDLYLNLMDELEQDFPDVKFVYMTGHLDGTGMQGNLHIRNEQIRAYCRDNNKILYDFADIESYGPDGLQNYNVLMSDDGCNYDANRNDILETDGGDPGNPVNGDANWALDWQNSHTPNVDWFSCNANHSYSLNGNLKAYSAWHLWARLAGWAGNGGTNGINEQERIGNGSSIVNTMKLYQNYPNPFIDNTNVEYFLPENSDVEISLYDMLGKKIKVLFKGCREAGDHTLETSMSNIAAGTYYYRLEAGNNREIRKCIIIK
ncbi:MAG: T9SS type A sorting domain-containing protein [Clostridiales bacterium]|nr:T9SS type A sorting domain-containing protein [Clostridiales bacterium]